MLEIIIAANQRGWKIIFNNDSYQIRYENNLLSKKFKTLFELVVYVY